MNKEINIDGVIYVRKEENKKLTFGDLNPGDKFKFVDIGLIQDECMKTPTVKHTYTNAVDVNLITMDTGVFYFSPDRDEVILLKKRG